MYRKIQLRDCNGRNSRNDAWDISHETRQRWEKYYVIRRKGPGCFLRFLQSRSLPSRTKTDLASAPVLLYSYAHSAAPVFQHLGINSFYICAGVTLKFYGLETRSSFHRYSIFPFHLSGILYVSNFNDVYE